MKRHVAILLALVWWTLRPAFGVEVREAHYVMGTLLEITLDASDRPEGQRWIRSAVAEVRRLDRELTSFDAGSALSRLNRAAGQGFHHVPADLFRLVASSKELAVSTGGVFDISVGPFVELWKEAARLDRWPENEELAVSRLHVGYEKIRLRPPDGIELASEGMILELGGIGKGYAVDRVAEMLESAGVERALVSFGESSVRAIGAPAGEVGWPVWVRRGNALDGPIRLRDGALSTSRSRGRVWRVAGRSIGHILDPRTGLPLDDARQATVLAPTATEAEAWSKALLIDPAASFARCDRGREWDCVLLGDTGARVSRGFARRTGWSPRP